VRCWRSEAQTAYSTSGFIGVALERLQDSLFEDQHLLLRVLERRLTELQQLGAALVGGERILERQLAAFHPLDDRLELGERRFESGRWGFGHEMTGIRACAGRMWLPAERPLAIGAGASNIA
jgi:hypothetical protein